MGGFCGPSITLARCPHGVTRGLSRCLLCEAEAEAWHEEQRASIRDPVWVIEQAVKHRRRWYDGCAFCERPAALVVHTKHEHDCPFVIALASAWLEYGKHLGDVPSPSTTEEKP